MPELRPVLFVLGLLLMALACAMLVPAIVDAATAHPDWRVFAVSTGFTFAIGGMLMLSNFGREFRLNLRQGFILTFTIEEGEKYSFGAVDIQSNVRDVDPGALRGKLHISPGGTQGT